MVLAAGASLRMGKGRQKLLLGLGGRPMVRWVVEAATQCSAEKVVVITGQDHDEIAQALRHGPNVDLIRNPDPSRGMLSSVRCGLEGMPSPAGVAVLLGDQPGVRSDLIDAVVQAWHQSEQTIAVPTHGGRRGHPLVFDGQYREEISTRFDAVGLRGLLASHPEQVLEVPWPSSDVLQDIDTPADFAALRGSIS